MKKKTTFNSMQLYTHISSRQWKVAMNKMYLSTTMVLFGAVGTVRRLDGGIRVVIRLKRWATALEKKEKKNLWPGNSRWKRKNWGMRKNLFKFSKNNNKNTTKNNEWTLSPPVFFNSSHPIQYFFITFFCSLIIKANT